MLKIPIRMILLSVLLSASFFPLIAQQNATSAEITELLQKISIDSINKHIEELCWADGYQSRVTYTPGNYAAAEYIAGYFERLPGITSVSRDTFYLAVANAPYDTYPLINVIATLEGQAADPGVAIVGGHYDASGSNDNNYSGRWSTIKAQGADDNATGVAVTMELARILSDPANSFRNQQTIDFMAFGAEEYHPQHSSYHHVGSLWDAKLRDADRENLIGVLVLDMIAYNPNGEYIEVISDENSLWLADIVYDNAQSYIPEISMNETPADVPYSDHESYQAYGFPAILLMENDKPWNNDPPHYTANPVYHTAGDTIGLLNLLQLELVAKLALATLADPALGEVTASVEEFANEQKPVDDFQILTVRPNPFNNRVTILVNSNYQTVESVAFFNILGERVADLSATYAGKSGIFQVQWSAGNLPSGIYFCRVQTNQDFKAVKMVLKK